MRTIAALVCALLLASLSGCGGGQVREVPEEGPGPVVTEDPPSDPGPDGVPEEDAPDGSGSGSEGDAGPVLASLDGGQSVRVDLIGSSGEIHTLLVYADGELVQTIPARELSPDDPAPLPDGVLTASGPGGAVSLHDVDFDGLDDLDITLPDGGPSVWWLWDPGASAFRYGASMRDPTFHEDTREISVTYPYDGDVDFTDWYRWDGGSLVLSRRRAEDWRNGTEDFPLTDWYAFAPDGSAVLERQESTDYDDRGQVLREVRVPSDGALVPILRERLVSDGMGGWVVASSEPIEAPPDDPGAVPGG